MTGTHAAGTGATAPLRIVHVETGAHLYGGAAQVLYLMTGLRELGVGGLLVAPEGSAIADAGRGRGLDVRAIPFAGEADVRFIPRLAALLRAERPDLVHCHSRRGADTLGGIAARMAARPAVVSRRVDNPESRWVALPRYRLYRRIITISERIRQEVLTTGVAPEKVVTVRSAVEVERWSGPGDPGRFATATGAAPGEVILGVAAQLIERKGHRDLLEALPAILDSRPEVRVVFFGRGPLEDELRNRARALGVASRVVFAGFVDDLPAILPLLDILVHPAHMEGLGVILLQASAAGVPIVAGRAGGIPEAVREGVNGLLVDPGAPDQLGAAVLRILKDPELAGRLGQGGRTLAHTEFSVEAMVRGNLAVYQSVLAEA